MKIDRGIQILRQWFILRACLITGGRCVEDLVRLLQTGRRTIYRDLQILKKAGANIETRREGPTIYYFSKQPFFQALEPVTPHDTAPRDSKHGRTE